MTSHEFAKMLLSLPDKPLYAEDGMDPSDPSPVNGVEECTHYDGDGFLITTK